MTIIFTFDMQPKDKKIIESVEKLPEETISVSKERLLRCIEESPELRRVIQLLVPALNIKSESEEDLKSKVQRFSSTDLILRYINIRSDGPWSGLGLYLDNCCKWRIIQEPGCQTLICLPERF